MWCYVDANEAVVLKYQRMAREGQQIPALLSLLNDRDFSRAGHIDFLDNNVNRNTGTLRIRGGGSGGRRRRRGGGLRQGRERTKNCEGEKGKAAHHVTPD